MNVWTLLALIVGSSVVSFVGAYLIQTHHNRYMANLHEAERRSIRHGTSFDDELAMIEAGVLAAEPVPEGQAVFISDPDSGDTKQEHRDGVDWHDAPIPPRLHRCFVQTRGWSNMFTRVHRCACGAIRIDGGPWMDRNSRKVKS